LEDNADKTLRPKKIAGNSYTVLASRFIVKYLFNIRGDIFGGLTAAVVALPLALAFGVASGAGALAGLYGAILLGFFAAIFGGTPTQISGPTGPITVIIAILFMRFSDAPELVFTVIMLGGLFQILFGLLRFGTYINLVPYPVISGFMSGIGCIIIILQLAPFVGQTLPEGNMLNHLYILPGLLSEPRIGALIPGLASLLIIFFSPARLRSLFPPPLLALVVGTAIAWFWFPLAPVIGDIPTGLPELHFPVFNLADFSLVIRFALILAFLGSIDSLLTSLIADSLTRDNHNSNQELVGQGIGNLIAGIFGAIPGAGATMRTVINVRSGGKTPLSGVIHALVLLIIVLGFSGLVVHIPLAVLAGILLKVGIDIIDWRYLKRILRAPKAGVFIMLTTLMLTVIVDLITAVAVGMIMASVLFVKRMADTQMQSLRLVNAPSQSDDLLPEESAILENSHGRIVIFHIEGPMSFGSAKDIARVLRSSKNQDVLLIDLSDVTFIDSSASITLEEVITDIQKSEDIVIVCGARQRVREVIDKFGIANMLQEGCMVETRLQGLRKADAILKQNP